MSGSFELAISILKDCLIKTKEMYETRDPHVRTVAACIRVLEDAKQSEESALMRSIEDNDLSIKDVNHDN